MGAIFSCQQSQKGFCSSVSIDSRNECSIVIHISIQVNSDITLYTFIYCYYESTHNVFSSYREHPLYGSNKTKLYKHNLERWVLRYFAKIIALSGSSILVYYWMY